MNRVYVSIGTNMGEREENLKLAVKLLTEAEHIQVEAVSSIYETAPVGFVDQASFFNIAVRLTTSLSAADMLKTCQYIEQELGRVREFRWGPRSIDLDILLYNHENIETESLIVPHERMYERAFVLVPLMEIAQADTTQLVGAQKALQLMNIEKEGVMQWKKGVTVEEFVHFEN